MSALLYVPAAIIAAIVVGFLALSLLFKDELGSVLPEQRQLILGPPEIVLLDTACESSRRSGVVICEGSVRSLAHAPVSGIEIVVTWVDTGGTVWATHRGRLGTDPLPAQATATWRTAELDFRLLRRFTIHFEDSSGRRVPHTSEGGRGE